VTCLRLCTTSASAMFDRVSTISDNRSVILQNGRTYMKAHSQTTYIESLSIIFELLTLGVVAVVGGVHRILTARCQTKSSNAGRAIIKVLPDGGGGELAADSRFVARRRSINRLRVRSISGEFIFTSEAARRYRRPPFSVERSRRMCGSVAVADAAGGPGGESAAAAAAAAAAATAE
jgi:hypothetical protein